MIASPYISESWPTSRSGAKDKPSPSLLRFAIRKHPPARGGREWVSDQAKPLSPTELLPLYKALTQTAVKVRAQSLPDDSRQLLRGLLIRSDASASIEDFPGEPYRVLKSIPVKFKWMGEEYLARFEEANIAMTGSTCSEAKGNLTAAILDTFEDYLAETVLGPAPAHQLAVLRRHIAER